MRNRYYLIAGAAGALAWLGPANGSHGIAELVDAPVGLEADYETAPVTSAELVRHVVATGSLNANVNVDVGSQLSGQVDSVLVDFNDNVRKGQILAKLDETSFRAQYDAAKASLEGARAEVRIAEAKLSRAAVEEEQAAGQKAVLAARLDEARIAAETAQRSARRKIQLSGSGAVSAVDAQETSARSEVAAASVHEAEAILASQTQTEGGARVDRVRAIAELEVAQAAMKRWEAQLESARIDLERTRIRSPIDGVVVGRNVTEGQTLASALEARTLFVVAGDLRSMEVDARIDESDIAEIHPGQRAQFTVDAYPGRVFAATVKQVRKAPQVIQNVVTYVVVLTAPNEDLSLLPGMTAVAKIETARAVAPVSVPLAALRFRPKAMTGSRLKPGSATEVWVLRRGWLKEVPVTVGAQDHEKAAISGGDLRPGDLILTGDRHNGRSASGSEGEG